MSHRRVAVVGAGVAGPAAAHTLRRDAPTLDVVVLEQAPRIGGLIDTEHTPEGFLIEHGADSLITTKPWGIRATRELGLGDEIALGPEPRRSYLATDGALVPIPAVVAGPTVGAVLSILRSTLLSTRSKARLALEPLLPARRDEGDESVASFIDRRFGRELREAVLEPMLGGIYGGRAAELSAEACLPRLREFERDHGSITRGLHRAIRARRRLAVAESLPAMVTLQRGMISLPEAYAARLGDRLKLGTTVSRIATGENGGFRVETAGGVVACEGVVVAVPAWRAPALLESIDGELAGMLGDIRHTGLDCVTLAWPERVIPRTETGTGFLTAIHDGRSTRACTWSSRKWPGRAPAGHLLVRSVLHLPDATDAEVLAEARRDLQDLMGITAPPLFSRVRRLSRATPILEVGHPTRVAAMQARAEALGAMALAGNAHGGLGIPDCIRSGEVAAHAVLAALAG